MLVMLRNRSRRVTTKQALMCDGDSPSPSTTQRNTKPITSFLGSPRFKAFTSKGLPTEAEPVMIPTSIFDTTKRFSPFKNPIWCEAAQPKYPRGLPAENKHSWGKLDSKGIGIALIQDSTTDELFEEECGTRISKPINRAILSGTKIRVQIPPIGSPISADDFGIKTRNPQLLIGPSNSGIQANDSPQIFTGFLSMSEMELSEDYTCVISHGPNPTTTHIFGNCIVDNCCFVSDKANSSPKDFLSFCHTCKKNLEQKHDIHIYRGEKAFCSPECRYQEMLLDGVENRKFDDDKNNGLELSVLLQGSENHEFKFTKLPCQC